MSGPRSHSEGQSLEIWRIDLRQTDAWVEEAAASIVGPAEVVRHRRERELVWRRRVVARAALRIAPGRALDLPARRLSFEVLPGGKPGLSPRLARQLQFNLTRSGDLCLIAVSQQACVGVDVEEVREFPELDAVAGSRLAPEEGSAVLACSGEERVRSFYRCWTRKEAYLKGLGIGLVAEPDSVAVSVGGTPAITRPEGEPWSLCDLDLEDGFVGAVAVRYPHDIQPAAKLSVIAMSLGQSPTAPA